MRFLPRAIVAAALLAPAVAAAQDEPIVGDWYGTLQTPGAALPLVFRIKADGTATFDSPAQHALGLAATATVVDGKVSVTLQAIHAGFQGAASADGNSLTGVWTQGDLPLTMTRTAPAAAPAPKRPQTPKPPFPYRAEDVTYVNPASGLKLAGTLTLPRGSGCLLYTSPSPRD